MVRNKHLMTRKKHATIPINTKDVLRAVEADLIQTWHSGTLEAPTSPLEAASLLAFQSLQWINAARGRPFPANPSEQEFSTMLTYIQYRHTFSTEFPFTHQQLIEDIASKRQEIQQRSKPSYRP